MDGRTLVDKGKEDFSVKPDVNYMEFLLYVMYMQTHVMIKSTQDMN